MDSRSFYCNINKRKAWYFYAVTMEELMKKVIILIFSVCFLFGITLDVFAGHRDAEISGRVARRIKPYKATDEAKIEAAGSRQRLEIQREEEGCNLNVENIGVPQAPDQEEFK